MTSGCRARECCQLVPQVVDHIDRLGKRQNDAFVNGREKHHIAVFRDRLDRSDVMLAANAHHNRVGGKGEVR